MKRSSETCRNPTKPGDDRLGPKRLNKLRVLAAHAKIGEIFRELDLSGPETLMVLADSVVSFCECWPAGMPATAQVFEALAKSIKDGKPGKIDVPCMLPLINWSQSQPD